MIIIVGIILLFNSLSSKLYGQVELINNVNQFSSEQWKKDTLGTKGYRMKVLSSFYALDSIKGGTKDWVIETLGEPDFVWNESLGQSLVYSLECDKVQIKNYRSNNNGVNNCGSFVSLSMDRDNKIRFALITHRD